VTELATSRDGYVVTLEIRRPPNNFLDLDIVAELGDRLRALDEDDGCRAIVLATAGKHFSAGADLGARVAEAEAGRARSERRHLYHEALRLFDSTKPIVAAVHGSAIGAGLGLALVCDFRVAAPESRLSVNFARQGYHPGFGTTCTLPRLVGEQKASWLFYTGARIGGDEALRIGLVDALVPQPEVRARAVEMAAEIAVSGPLAVVSTRATLRRNLRNEFAAAVEREAFEQRWLRETEDFREGVRAMNERRPPDFSGR
jgi:enoyl-CoA hydratase/carnithine racemase